MPYSAPTLAEFRVRYPAFDAVADATVQTYLDDGVADTTAWPDDIRSRAVMLLAAHHLAEQGLGTGSVMAGVSSFKSGTFSATLSDGAANRTGLSATIYGREYLALARRYFGGPRLAWTPPAHV